MKENTQTPPETSASRSQGIQRFSFNSILAPSDFSANSEKAVNYAIELARLLGAKLTLLHIIPEPSALDYTMGGIPKEEIEGWPILRQNPFRSALEMTYLLAPGYPCHENGFKHGLKWESSNDTSPCGRCRWNAA
jgi:hypothetical protein